MKARVYLLTLAFAALVPHARAIEDEDETWKTRLWTEQRSVQPGGTLVFNMRVERKAGEAFPISIYAYREGVASFGNILSMSPPDTPVSGGGSDWSLDFHPVMAAGDVFEVSFEATVMDGLPAGSLCGLCVYGVPYWYYVLSEVDGGNRTQRANPASCTAGDPVATATGEFVLPPETDLDLGGPLPLRLRRWYASAAKDRGVPGPTNALGSGWSHSFDYRLERSYPDYFLTLPTGKRVYVTEVSDSDEPALMFEDEPVRYRFRRDGAGYGWFHDPETDLLIRFDRDSWDAQLVYAAEIADRNGNALLLARRADGLVTNVTDGLGRALAFEYDGAGRLTRVTDGSRSVRYGYDAAGALVAVTNALGGVTLYTYDAAHSFANGNGALLTGVRYPRGNLPFTQTYDAQGRVTAQTDADLNASAFAYGPAEGEAQITDPAGAFSHRHAGFLRLTNLTDQAGLALGVAYNARGLPAAVTDRRGASARFVYEEDTRRLTAAVDPNACTTAYSYAWTVQTFTNRVTGTNAVTFSFRDLAQIRYADGTTESFARDRCGNVTGRTDRAGAAWAFSYNARGQPLAETNPLGGTVSYTYNADGTLATVSDAESGTTAFTYDARRRRVGAAHSAGGEARLTLDDLDRVTDWTNEVGAVSRLAHDANGVVTGAVDAAGGVRLVQTDAYDRPTRFADGLGELAATVYDSMGRVARVADPSGTNVYAYDLRGWVTNVTRGARFARYTYDAEGAVTQVGTAGGDAGAAVYDVLGRPVAVSDALSRTNAYAYDCLGRVTAATDAAGATTRFAYDAAGRLSACTNALGAVERFSYDALGRVSRRTDADGRSTDLAYSPLGRLLAQTNALGQVTAWSYDTRGLVSRETRADGAAVAYAYDVAGRLAALTNETGHAWRYAYDARGALAAVTNPAGGWVRTTYRPDGRVDSVRDSAGCSVSNRYDAARRLTERVLPDGAALRTDYNEHGEAVAVTDPEGRVTRFSYDDDGLLVAAADAASRTNRFAYDRAGQLTNMTDRTGASTRFAYDAAGRLTDETDATGVTTHHDYDAAGRLTARTRGAFTWRFAYTQAGVLTNVLAPSGRSVSFQPDALGRTAAAVNALGEGTAFQYDALGRVTNVTDAAGRSTGYRYEPRGLLAGVTEPDGRAAAYAYGPLGLPERLTDLNAREWLLAHTPEGRLLAVTDPLGRATTNTYDNLGRLSQRRFANGDLQDLRYDRSGRLTNVLYASGIALDYAYDAVGGLVQAGALALQRDGEGRVTRSATAGGPACGAAYDTAGRLQTVTYGDGAFSVTYTYSVGEGGDGRLLRVSDSLTGTQLEFGYDADRRLRTVSYPNGETVTYTWDAADRLVRIQSGAHTDLTYAYDRSGRVTNQVGQVPLEPAAGLAAGQQALTFDAASQIAAAGYSHDARGRLTAAPGRTYTWDGASRLTGIGGVTFAYDGLGFLTARTASGVTVRCDYNHALGGSNPLVAERDGATGAALRYYVRAPDGRLLYLIDAAAGNAVRYYHCDRNGSTLALTDAAAAVTDAYAYDPYGRLVGRTGGSPQPFTFVGAWGVRQEGAEGLYQMGARYYDAGLGRFLSPEPLWPQLSAPALLNPYQYAAQDPVRLIDPSGLEPFDDNIETDTPAFHYIRWAKSLSPFGLKIARKLMGSEFDDRLAAAYFEVGILHQLEMPRSFAKRPASGNGYVERRLMGMPKPQLPACRQAPRNTAPAQVLSPGSPAYMPLETDWWNVQTIDGPLGVQGISLTVAPDTPELFAPWTPAPDLQSLPDGTIPMPSPTAPVVNAQPSQPAPTVFPAHVALPNAIFQQSMFMSAFHHLIDTPVNSILTVVARKAAIRKSPDSWAATIVVLDKGEQVHKLEQRGIWSRVRSLRTGQEGWMHQTGVVRRATGPTSLQNFDEDFGNRNHHEVAVAAKG